MTKLLWLTDAYGYTSLPSKAGNREIRFLSDNSLWGNFGFGYYPNDHWRTYHTSNKVRFLDPFTPWRDPAPYGRRTVQIDLARTGDYKTGNGTFFYAKNSPIDPGYLWATTVNSARNPVFGSNYIPDSSKPAAKNGRSKAITKCLTDLSSSKAQMGANLAEVNRTVDDLSSIAYGTLDALRALRGLRRGRFPDWARWNVRRLKRLVLEGKVDRRIASYWLSYWYGWKPLYQDGVGLVELLQEQMSKSLLYHGRGRALETGNASYDAKSEFTYPNPQLRITENWDVRWTCNLTGKVRVGGEVARSLNRAGLANPISLVWEIIPFSFIVDWTTPIGETLNAFSAPIGLDFVGGSLTTRYEREIWGEPQSSYRMAGDGSLPALTSLRGFGFEREKFLSFPLPEYYEKTFFKGASRWATIAALVTSALR